MQQVPRLWGRNVGGMFEEKARVPGSDWIEGQTELRGWDQKGGGYGQMTQGLTDQMQGLWHSWEATERF